MPKRMLQSVWRLRHHMIAPAVRNVVSALPLPIRVSGLRVSGQRVLRLLLICALLIGTTVIATIPQSGVASAVNVLDNGGFEGGFGNQPGCGMVGTGWHCFTNGGGAN